MTSAIITGITGQDGSYMAELLLNKNYRVIGAVRDLVKADIPIPSNLRNRIELIDWDMLDQLKMVDVLSQYKPQEFYNFAALSSGLGMYNDAANIGNVNGISVTCILDAIKSTDPKIRFCQASSSEMFGDATETPQTEITRFSPRSPYGAAKLYAHSMIHIYRKKYGMFACSAILFNHESPRRGLEFVTRKISNEVAKIKLGLSSELRLGNLEARRDWGFAGDYVQGMWKMLQKDQADDYVFATGVTHSVAEVCRIAFTHVGLDYRNFVTEDINANRPTEYFQLVGDASKAHNELGWKPVINFEELICKMVDMDLNRLSI